MEVDLDYPKNLHEDHSDFPMAPEKAKIKEEWLSSYCLEIKEENNIKVDKILEFKQSAWMKPYIVFNTQKKKEPTNEAEKNLFKLLNNAVYDKTMENMRRRIQIRIIKNEKDFIKYASKPTYINHNIFGKRLVAIHEKKKNY